jgi:hypothetical protein
MTTKVFMCIGLVFFFSCEKPLLNPLEGSVDIGKGYKNSFNFQGRVIYFRPTKTLDVRSASSGRILRVIYLKDYGYIIIVQGKMKISYGYLAECFVKNDETVKRGEIIGRLFSTDSVSENSLAVSIEGNEDKFFN